MATWFTVDTDDFRHLPKHQGHPTRSVKRFEDDPRRLSSAFQTGWIQFLNWMETHDGAVTVFVITDLLNDGMFCFPNCLRKH